jgi:hypothetical protein
MHSTLKSLFQIFLFNIFVYSTIENLLSNYFTLSEKYANKYEKNLLNTHHRKTTSIKEIIKSTTPIENSAKNSNLINAYSLNGKLTYDYINLYAENVDKKDYINLINNHISLLNLIKSLNMSIFNNNSNVFSSYYTTKFYNQNNINLSLKVLNKHSSTTTKIYQNISQINSTKLLKLEPPIKISKKYHKIEINNNTESTKSSLDRSKISKNVTENFQINSKIEISSLPKSMGRNFFLNKSSYSTNFLVFNSKNSSNFSLGLNQNSSTANILILSYTTKIIKSTSFNNQNNIIWYMNTNNTSKMNSTSLNSDNTSSTRLGLIYITNSDSYKNEPTSNLQLIDTKKKNLVLNSTNNSIKSLIINNSTNLMTNLKMTNSTISKVTLMKSSKLGHIISEKSIKTKNVTSNASKINLAPKKFTKTFFSVNSSNLKLNGILDELIKDQELTSIKMIATTQNNISKLAKESSRTIYKPLYTTKTTSLSTFQLVSENLKKQNKLILTLDDLINSCPKSLENYCLNDGECYLKLYESSFLNFIEKLNGANVHSAIPNCKCKIQYSLNGLIMLSYSGLRCEIITHTFTYLTMGLLITLLIFILILAFLAAMIYKIIFTCYNTVTIKKKKQNNNISFSANSSEYGCSSNDLTLKNNFQNYLNNKLKWFRKLEFPSVRNSWKYIKINKNSDQNKQISHKSINNFGNSDKNENLFLNLDNINPFNSKNTTKPIKSKKNNYSKRNFYQKSKQNYNYHNKNNQIRKSTLNNQNNLQRYLTRRSRMLLKHFLYNSNENDLTAVRDENYLFSNRKIRSTYGINLSEVILSGTLSSNYSSFSLNHLENMCKSNLYVYPKPSRISFNSNRFNSSNPDHESNNGALYY